MGIAAPCVSIVSRHLLAAAIGVRSPFISCYRIFRGLRFVISDGRMPPGAYGPGHSLGIPHCPEEMPRQTARTPAQGHSG